MLASAFSTLFVIAILIRYWYITGPIFALIITALVIIANRTRAGNGVSSIGTELRARLTGKWNTPQR